MAVRSLCWVLAATAVLVSLSGATEAGSGRTNRINGHGYTVTVSTQWVDGYGYRPVRIAIVPNVPPTADEVITVRLSTGFEIREGSAIVERDIVIPAQSTNGGPAAGTGVMHVPAYDDWHQLNLQFVRNGRVLPRLSVPLNISASVGGWWTGGGGFNAIGSQTMLLVDSAESLLGAPGAPAIGPGGIPTTGVITITPGAAQAVAPSLAVQAATANIGNYDVLGIHPGELTESWLDLTPVDVIAISLAELEAMESQFPEHLARVRDWAFSGGTVWVYDTADDFSDLGDIERLMSLAEDESAWRTVEKIRNQRQGERVDLDRLPLEIDGQDAEGENSNAGGTEQQPNLGALAMKLRWRTYGMGTVTTVPLSKPDLSNTTEWAQVANDLQSLSSSWRGRHGLSPDSSNSDFWNYLIPGVGMPPVITFEILITMFVVIIGPVNYLLLRKRRRLHLLVITVPLMALIVTAGLFAYALASDGLGVRVMARSFTYLDQRQDQAACWTRLSYYAGIAPSRGLVFSDDVAVYPINGMMNLNNMELLPRHTTWTDEQNLQTGWLESRTPMQLMTVRSRASTYQLNVTENAGSAPVVQNLLNTRVHQLLLSDSDGAIFAGNDIPLAGQTTLTPFADADEPIDKMRDAIIDGMPDPINAPQTAYNYWGNSGDNTIRTSLLELHIDAVQGMLGKTVALPPRSYIAIVESSPESQTGLENAEQESSLHIIYGRW